MRSLHIGKTYPKTFNMDLTNGTTPATLQNSREHLYADKPTFRVIPLLLHFGLRFEKPPIGSLPHDPKYDIHETLNHFTSV